MSTTSSGWKTAGFFLMIPWVLAGEPSAEKPAPQSLTLDGYRETVREHVKHLDHPIGVADHGSVPCNQEVYKAIVAQGPLAVPHLIDACEQKQANALTLCLAMSDIAGLPFEAAKADGAVEEFLKSAKKWADSNVEIREYKALLTLVEELSSRIRRRAWAETLPLFSDRVASRWKAPILDGTYFTILSPNKGTYGIWHAIRTKHLVFLDRLGNGEAVIALGSGPGVDPCDSDHAQVCHMPRPCVQEKGHWKLDFDPWEKVDSHEIQALVLDLDGDRFEVREKAQARLVSIGLPTVALLKEATRGGSPEARTRAQAALERISWDPGLETLRRHVYSANRGKTDHLIEIDLEKPLFGLPPLRFYAERIRQDTCKSPCQGAHPERLLIIREFDDRMFDVSDADKLLALISVEAIPLQTREEIDRLIRIVLFVHNIRTDLWNLTKPSPEMWVAQLNPATARILIHLDKDGRPARVSFEGMMNCKGAMIPRPRR